MKHKMAVIGVVILILIIVVPRSKIYKEFREEKRRKERVQKYLPEIQELILYFEDVLNGRILIEDKEHLMWIYAFNKEVYKDAVKQEGMISVWDIDMDETRGKAIVDMRWNHVLYDAAGKAISWGGDWDRIMIEKRDGDWVIIDISARIPSSAELKLEP